MYVRGCLPNWQTVCFSQSTNEAAHFLWSGSYSYSFGKIAKLSKATIQRMIQSSGPMDRGSNPPDSGWNFFSLAKLAKVTAHWVIQVSGPMDQGSNPHDSGCFFFSTDRLFGRESLQKASIWYFHGSRAMGKMCLFHKSRFSPEGLEIVKIELTTPQKTPLWPQQLWPNLDRIQTSRWRHLASYVMLGCLGPDNTFWTDRTVNKIAAKGVNSDEGSLPFRRIRIYQGLATTFEAELRTFSFDWEM